MAQLIDLGKLRFYWTGEWSSTQQYETNDVVKYGGNVYVYTYTLADTGILPTDDSHWALMIQGIRFQGAYSASTTYRIGDGVAYGGTVYLALRDNTGIAPTDATNGATNWTRFLEGIQYEGTYSATTAYQKGDMVVLGPNAYIAKRDTTGNVPTNTTFFDRLVSGISVQGVYNAATTYQPGQVVAYGARLYQATAVTTGTAPATATGTVNTGWQLFQDAIRDRGVWGGNATYYPNDVVTRGGSTYIALREHVSASATAPPVDSTNWRKYNSGIRWRGALTASTAYLVDDVFTDGLNTWLVTADFTSTADTAQAPGTYSASLTLMARGADYLPAQANQAGKFLTTDGTTPSWSQVIDAWKTITATYTAAAKDALFVNTTSTAITVTLPSTPAVSDYIKVADLAGTFATNNCTLSRGGQLINGLAENLVLNVRNASVTLVYSGATFGWKVI